MSRDSFGYTFQCDSSGRSRSLFIQSEGSSSGPSMGYGALSLRPSIQGPPIDRFQTSVEPTISQFCPVQAEFQHPGPLGFAPTDSTSLNSRDVIASSVHSTHTTYFPIQNDYPWATVCPTLSTMVDTSILQAENFHAAATYTDTIPLLEPPYSTSQPETSIPFRYPPIPENETLDFSFPLDESWEPYTPAPQLSYDNNASVTSSSPSLLYLAENASSHGSFESGYQDFVDETLPNNNRVETTDSSTFNRVRSSASFSISLH
jgi:hypothetical protein